MFWWAVPVGFTGFLLFTISLLAFLVASLLYESDFFPQHPNIVTIIVLILVALIAISFIAMITGFFFWALGEIWTPFL